MEEVQSRIRSRLATCSCPAVGSEKRVEGLLVRRDSESVGREYYESRNPGSWNALTWWEKLHMAVLAERAACEKICFDMAQQHNDIRSAALEVAAERIRARGNSE